jgi:hypothetical protein
MNYKIIQLEKFFCIPGYFYCTVNTTNNITIATEEKIYNFDLEYCIKTAPYDEDSDIRLVRFKKNNKVILMLSFYSISDEKINCVNKAAYVDIYFKNRNIALSFFNFLRKECIFIEKHENEL